MNELTYQKREGGGPVELSQEIIGDLKGDHHDFGRDKENYNTSYMKSYDWKQPEKNMYANEENV